MAAPASHQPPPSFRLRPNEIIDGKYTLDIPIGAGGMALLWQGRDPAGTPVAIKVLDPTRLSDALIGRLLQEAHVMSLIPPHPHIVRFIGSGMERDVAPYIVMELLSGRDLFDAQPELTDGEKVRILLQLLSVIRHLRSVQTSAENPQVHGLVHGDIKPENVFLCWIDGEIHAKVIDFGIAVLPEELRQTLTGSIVGTPGFATASRLMGMNVSWIDDVFSVAAIAHFLWTGDAPYAERCRKRTSGNETVIDPGAMISLLMSNAPLAPFTTGISRLDHWIVRCLELHRDPETASLTSIESELAAILAEMEKRNIRTQELTLGDEQPPSHSKIRPATSHQLGPHIPRARWADRIAAPAILVIGFASLVYTALAMLGRVPFFHF